MKIAVPVTIDNHIDRHFGHCQFYNVYSISDENRIVGEKRIKSQEGCGCKSGIASVLTEKG